MADQGLHRAIISVGANIRPDENITAAREILAVEAVLVGESAIIETDPVGFQDQPNFLNGAFVVDTELEREPFVAFLKNIEQRLGRVKTADKSGPRPIDLDLIIWDSHIVHEDYYSKDYVIIPVAEVIKAHDTPIFDDRA
jgi:2-amino-4-hydroxy-6-hydroxymethyldihydropteridine diphosphokinase